jgi:hypothetical protein
MTAADDPGIPPGIVGVHRTAIPNEIDGEGMQRARRE